MQVKTAKSLLNYRPSIKIALNKTEYFMNQLKEAYPQIAEKLTPVSEYRVLKYNIEVLYTRTFSDAIECKEFETKLKQIIRPNLYIPKRWEYKTSTETFTNELLPIIKENLIYDIVSTSNESQSSDESKDSNTDVN